MATVTSAGTLTSTGIGSGLDIDSLVTKLVAADRSAGQTRIDNKKTDLTSQFSAMATLMGSMSSLQATLNSLTSAGGFDSRSVSVSDDTAFTAKAGSSAVSGTYDVQVKQIAKAAQLGSTAFASATAAIGTGTLTISTGSSSFSIDVASGANTVANIRDAINKSSQNTGVQASLLTDVDGTHLVLTSTKTGANSALTVSASGGDDGLQKLAYDPSPSGTKNMKSRTDAQDAIVFVSGYEIHSSSNTVSNAIEGVTLTLKAPTDTGSTVSMDIERDNAAIQGAAQKFVDGYNSLVGTIKSLGKYDPSTSTGGPLLGDAMLRNIESQVRNLISAPVSGVAGSYNTLASLGILTQADGTLKLDTDKFNKALIANPGSVTSIFASDNGVAVKLANLMGSKTSTTGELTVRSSDITDSLQGLKDDQDALDARMKIVQDRYYKQFNALDTLLAQLKTTSSSLDSWLSVNDSSKNK
jgi:flagellar hook-associated protein 2